MLVRMIILTEAILENSALVVIEWIKMLATSLTLSVGALAQSSLLIQLHLPKYKYRKVHCCILFVPLKCSPEIQPLHHTFNFLVL